MQITKSAKQSKTQNIPAYAYQGSIYFFHSNLQTQNIFKQNYEFNQARNGEMAFTELVKTPLGAIKSKILLLLSKIVYNFYSTLIKEGLY